MNSRAVEIKVFYDVETTGLNEYKHSIHQIAGLIEVNEEITERFNFLVRPHPKALFEPQALKTCNKTKEELLAYPEMKSVYKEFTKLLDKYIDKFDRTDKAWLIGFNNRFFDDRFLAAWSQQCGDDFLASYFYFGIDVQTLASEYLRDRRARMPSFKLKRVAIELGIVIDEKRLHDASYDVELTYEIYRIVTGKQIEL